MEWLLGFPHMEDERLRALKKAIDGAFRNFTSTYGDSFEVFFQPLQTFLNQSERFMTTTPWPIIILLVALIAWFASRSWKIVLGCVLTLMAIGYLDMDRHDENSVDDLRLHRDIHCHRLADRHCHGPL